MNAIISQVQAVLTPERRRFLKFSVVGASGVFVNELFLWLFYSKVFTGLVSESQSEAARLLAFGGDGAFFPTLALACAAMLLPRSFHHGATFLGGNRLTWGGAGAIGVSIFTNFILNDIWTWGDRRSGARSGFFGRLGKYYAVATVAGVVQWTVLKVATETFGVPYLVSNLLGVAAGLVINYVVNNVWTFRASGGAS